MLWPGKGGVESSSFVRKMKYCFLGFACDMAHHSILLVTQRYVPVGGVVCPIRPVQIRDRRSVLLCEEGDTNHQACHISDRCRTGAVVRLLCAASDVARPGLEPDKQGAISNLFFAGEQAGQVEQFTIHSSPNSRTPSHVSGLSKSGDENEVLFLGAN